jgi:rfaE bifunctional protein kinase chain/domain
MPLDRTRAAGIIDSFAERKVVVLGDLMLDHFIWGSVSRISPEAPVPVVRVTRESFHLGGSGNVVSNLAALGAVAVPVGVVGADESGRLLVHELEQRGPSRKTVLEVFGRVTTKKTRIVAHAQQVVRFDREEDAPLAGEDEERVVETALSALREASALVISDYEKGAVTPGILGEILPAAEGKGLPVVVDPKPLFYESYKPVTAVTPNVHEAALMSRLRIRDEEDAAKAAGAIREHLGCRAVLLTLGEKGMLLCEEGSGVSRIPTAAREVYDVTGAGDTVVAAFSLSLAAGATMAEAAAIANAAAGVVVGKVGTATVNPDELKRAL